MRSLLRAAAPLLLTALLFVAVLRSGSPAPLWRTRIPSEPLRRDRCTWYCHNHGCPHAPALPLFLTGDDYLFGRTVAALHAAGSAAFPGQPGAGYGAMNLLAFCVLWPGLMYALYLTALRQRDRLRALREAGR